jgi:hypothetical protein
LLFSHASMLSLKRVAAHGSKVFMETVPKYAVHDSC